MAAEILTEDLLRVSLERLAREVVKTHPHFSDTLARSLMRTCGLLPDPERAKHYNELGTLLIDLGRLYLAEAEVLGGGTALEEQMP
ncbi:hypothetical protein [Lentzea flava]|uniref:Uncharacterized protein n=1 Tax=Lentzea flava TaxID=103732 RepID=A0ABQ2UQ62_9PSEU|nr:hypothetical protein [Lentzea flava]MCP2200843.1 hypothetical protein [Lentzea flava]GGU47495.1 hypothetical protein GCM10010178_45250 [Lentzea flava]